MKPTAETYAELQLAYDVFNTELFDGALPECLITLQREKRTYGYFSAQRFANRNGDTTDEIALNPSFFAVLPLVEIMQTLVHEMAHLWQHHYGDPGRGRYHNAQWADKMESVGLMPSSTGRPGGRRTGDLMADYAIEGGRFLQVCRGPMTRNFQISWYDRFSTSRVVQQVAQASDDLSLELSASGARVDSALDGGVIVMGSVGSPVNKSNRSKYTCACDINVWGKPGINIVCGECQERFREHP